MICDRYGVPLEVGQRVVFAWPLIDAKVVELKEIVAPGQARGVKFMAIFDFPLTPEDGPMPKLPVTVTAAQEKETSATSRKTQ